MNKNRRKCNRKGKIKISVLCNPSSGIKNGNPEFKIRVGFLPRLLTIILRPLLRSLVAKNN